MVRKSSNKLKDQILRTPRRVWGFWEIRSSVRTPIMHITDVVYDVGKAGERNVAVHYM